MDMKKKVLKSGSKTDWARLARMLDSEIDYSDIPALGPDFFRNAKLWVPKTKKMVSIRLDEEVLTWFKQQGPGYQTKINEILKIWMKSKAA